VTARQADSLVRDRWIIVLAYALAWLPMVVNRGYFWDDWALVGLSPGQTLTLSEAGGGARECHGYPGILERRPSDQVSRTVSSAVSERGRPILNRWWVSLSASPVGGGIRNPAAIRGGYLWATSYPS
jgi:hypothetical protein